MFSNERPNLTNLIVFINILILPFTIAEAPLLQTPAPVIFLADNLNERDNLGWCMDTLGHGFSEQLHTHSCKPNGGDVQFSYNEDSQQIMSVAFAGKCATLNTDTDSQISFALLDCLPDAANQRFRTVAL